MGSLIVEMLVAALLYKTASAALLTTGIRMLAVALLVIHLVSKSEKICLWCVGILVLLFIGLIVVAT